METRIERVRKMEAALDACTKATAELREKLEALRDGREEAVGLFGYYGSEAWHGDREAPLPPDGKSGVLSEDAVYDAITDLRNTAFDMLETATDILKNWI